MFSIHQTIKLFFTPIKVHKEYMEVIKEIVQNEERSVYIKRDKIEKGKKSGT